MELFITTLLFIIHCYFLGFSAVKLTKTNLEKEHIFLRILFTFLVGFSVLNIIPFLLGLLGIPIHIMAITITSVLLFTITIFILNKKGTLKQTLIQQKDFTSLFSIHAWKKSAYILGIIILILLSTNIYATGTFATNHFEDSDPWVYACLADYIATEHTYYVEDGIDCGAANVYLKPLPRRLTVLFGLYAQTNHNLQDTMKYMFNYFLFIGIIGFILLSYLLFNRNIRKTFLASLFMISVPAFLGRFIFENSLGIFLLAAALIPIIQLIKGEHKWWLLGGITLGAQIIAHPPTSIFSALFIGITGIFLLIEERKQLLSHRWKRTRLIKLIYLTLIAASIFLIYIIQPFMMYPGEGLQIEQQEIHFGHFSPDNVEPKYMDWIKQYNPAYSLKTIAITKKVGRMDQPEGIGIILFILLLLSIPLYTYQALKKKKTIEKIILVNFVITTLLLIFGWKTNFALFTSRFWPVVIFFSAIVFAASFDYMLQHIKKAPIRMLIILLLLVGVYFTSFVQDASIQKSPWPQHQYHPGYDQAGYEFIYSNIAPETKIFPICKNGFFLLGLNKKYDYTGTHDEYLSSIKNQTSQEIFTYLQTIDYKLFTIDTKCLEILGTNKTNDILTLMGSTQYEVLYNNDAFFLLQKPGN